MKITRARAAAALVLLIIAAAAIVNYYLAPKPITSWDYRGNTVNFRVDLREADKVPVYPHETGVYLDIMHPLVQNITIAFKDAGSSENPYYVVEEFEIINKMRIAYGYILGTKTESGYIASQDIPTFNAIEVSSYENLPGKIQNPIIALVHPVYANETSVRNEGHVTVISGKTPHEFDLAVAKFLMVILDIELADQNL